MIIQLTQNIDPRQRYTLLTLLVFVNVDFSASF